MSDEEARDFYYCWFIRDITERKRVEDELQKANENLSNYVTELEQRNRETELFSEMVSLLQACVTIEEVQSVIGRIARELFATRFRRHVPDEPSAQNARTDRDLGREQARQSSTLRHGSAGRFGSAKCISSMRAWPACCAIM